jgi:hypothetical protein
MMDREIALKIFNDNEEVEVRPYSDLLWIYPNHRYGNIFRPNEGDLNGIVIEGAYVQSTIRANYSDIVPIKKLMAGMNVEEAVLVRPDCLDERMRNKVVHVDHYTATGLAGKPMGSDFMVSLKMDEIYPPSKIFRAKHLNRLRPKGEEWTVFSEIGKIRLCDDGILNANSFVIDYSELGVCLNNYELAIRHKMYKWSESAIARDYIIYYNGSWHTPPDVPFYTIPWHGLLNLQIAPIWRAEVKDQFAGRVFGTPYYTERESREIE